MRVFCPEHKRGFFAPRQSPIKCENRGHLLGEIDFEGQAVSPVDLQWQYCCNCEHFCPVDFDQYGLQRCPVCTRKSSLIYLCDRCYVISFESNTPLQTKNFTLTGEGVPQPSCPGCLRPALSRLARTHLRRSERFVHHRSQHLSDLRRTSGHRAGLPFTGRELLEENKSGEQGKCNFRLRDRFVRAG